MNKIILSYVVVVVVGFAAGMPAVIHAQYGGGGGMPVAAIAPVNKVGDINHDGLVDEIDFSLLMSEWSQAGKSLSADLNHDGQVDENDFSILMSNWGL